MPTRFTVEHEWVALEQDVATVGISDHAQRTLGDLVFVQLPKVGTRLEQGGVAGVVESVKAASDLYAPMSGVVLAVNQAVVDRPALVNEQPLGEGWLFKLTAANVAEFAMLLDERAYLEIAK